MLLLGSWRRSTWRYTAVFTGGSVNGSRNFVRSVTVSVEPTRISHTFPSKPANSGEMPMDNKYLMGIAYGGKYGIMDGCRRGCCCICCFNILFCCVADGRTSALCPVVA